MPPQPNPRAAWPSHDDNGGFFLIVAFIGLCILACVLWLNFHPVISRVVMALYHGEIGLLRHFTDRFDLADRQMSRADPAYVTLRDLYGIAHDVGFAVRIPAAVLMTCLAGLCMWRAAPSRFKRIFDIDGLIREQARSFPANAAFAERHLKLVPLSDTIRPADYALTPHEWISRHARRKDGSFDEALASQSLGLQLGPPWRGVEHAAPHVRGLFAAFALHLSERRNEAQGLLGRLSSAIPRSGADTPEGPETPLRLPDDAIIQTDVILRDFDVLLPAAAITARHGYTHTALMALLNDARLRAGVLAPAQFVWLRLVDRDLWYALHSLGFETEGFGMYQHPNPRIEAVGVRDHWASERIARRALGKPEIARALDAVRKVAARRSAANDQGF